MIYGYARVSTVAQAKDGNSLESQREKLMSAGAQEVYFDSYTGTTSDRPEFNKLMELIKAGDTLMVTKVDRLTRSLIHGHEIITELKNRGVTVNILNFGIINDTPSGKFMLNIFMSFAEFERDSIVERTSDGKEIKKATDPNFVDGRPPREIKGLDVVYLQYKRKEITLEDALAILDIPRSTWFYRTKELRHAIQ